MNPDQEKITRVKKAILSGGETSSLQEIIDSDAKAFDGIKMLYSTNFNGAELQVDESSRHVLCGIFSNNKLLAYSDSISREMEIGLSTILYKRRVLFDTNFISDLPSYFLGEELTTRDRIKDVLSIIEHDYAGGFDYVFPMLENLREFTRDNVPHPVKKVAAAIYYDHRLRGADSAENAHPDIFAPYYLQAESVWMQFRHNQYIWERIDQRDLIYSVMLKTFHLCWTHEKLSIESALHSLVDYCINDLGVLPLKELYFAWKAIIGFSIGHYTPAFDESSLKSPKKDSINRIGALAWDLYMFRFVETLLTEEEGNTFYIPTITTLDKGLLSTIASCPVKAMISFKHLQHVETIFEDEALFQQCLNAALSIKQIETLTSHSRGIKGHKRARYFVSLSIAHTEKQIRKLI
ncbi:hypothetical protein [Pseudomonas sp. dw_612]|uniref:hypothetical protein n=1 Tax=Pseudomonas sp. dw_612 TaxID=2720080 RepID=UPI001BD4004C|nr:hypothetical protein [Pseudomonas sp. dw_612]